MSIMDEIRQYLKRTNTPPTKLGRMALNDPRAVHDFLNGREPREKAIRRLRACMLLHPEGWPQRVERKSGAGRYVVKQNTQVNLATQYSQPTYYGKEPDREPCPYCQIRGDLGCKHRPPYKKIEIALRTGTLDKPVYFDDEEDDPLTSPSRVAHCAHLCYNATLDTRRGTDE